MKNSRPLVACDDRATNDAKEAITGVTAGGGAGEGKKAVAGRMGEAKRKTGASSIVGLQGTIITGSTAKVYKYVVSGTSLSSREHAVPINDTHRLA